MSKVVLQIANTKTLRQLQPLGESELRNVRGGDGSDQTTSPTPPTDPNGDGKRIGSLWP
jgi:hypothetical protein